jgi:glycerate kinase
MKILIAPDSFKGSLSALEVAANIEQGILKVMPEAEIYKIPMADGGEGTVHSLVAATGGKIIHKTVTGPIGEPVAAYFGILGTRQTAVIEMASASGLPLVSPEKTDPRKTTTYGTGELIKAALNEGVNRIIIGLGGSATNDAGVGMAQALGIKFLDRKGQEIGSGGAELMRIETIDITGLDSRIKNVEITVASDVSNPLYGPEGAAYIFGPQKGATPEIVKYLDDCLRHYAGIIKRELGIDLQKIPGAGAAGGLGAGLVVFLNAKIKSGIQTVMEANRIDEYLKKVDLVITGEGKIDGQTLMGKTPVGIARKAKEYNLPVIAIAGSVDDDAVLAFEAGIDSIFSITQRPTSLEEAIKNTAKWIKTTSEQIMRGYLINNRLKA